MAPKSPEEEQEALQSAIKASAEEAAPVEAASKTANSSSPANVATPPGETPGKMAKEKNAKENAEEKRKKKGCQQRHRVELNPLKTETDLRSLWNSENHTKEQACEVLAKLVDSRHITGKHFEHSALVQDIMVFLKERAEREGVCKVLKRCADALCFWSAAEALQQQRRPGQDTLRTGAQIRSPPAARPVRKLGGAGKALLLAGLAVAGCAWLVFSVKTGLVTWNASSIDKSAPVVDCAWLLPAVETGLVDLNAASMANPAPSRMQDCGWLLVLLVLRAFGGWGVRYVAHQQQKLRPKRERACGAAGDTICLNPGKGTGGEAADSRSCSGGGVAPHRMLRVAFAAQKRGLSRRARMERKREKRRRRRAIKADIKAKWREMLQCATHPGLLSNFMASVPWTQGEDKTKMRINRTPGCKRRNASSVSATNLVVLVAASLVGSAQAYSCTSDSDCQYPNCNDQYCSESWSSYCVNAKWLASCNTASSYCVFAYTYGKDGNYCGNPSNCPAGTYSDTGKNYGGDRVCRLCDAGKYAARGVSSLQPLRFSGSEFDRIHTFDTHTLYMHACIHTYIHT